MVDNIDIINISLIFFSITKNKITIDKKIIVGILLPVRNMQRKDIKKLIKKNEFIFFLIYRFIGGIPFFISNVLPTLFNVKVRNFFLGSLIGMAPQLFVGASLGAGLNKILEENSEVPSLLELVLTPDIYLPIIGMIILVLIGFLLRKKFYRN